MMDDSLQPRRAAGIGFLRRNYLGLQRLGPSFGTNARFVSEPKHPPCHYFSGFLRGALVLAAEAVQVLLHVQEIGLVLLVEELPKLRIALWRPDLFRGHWPQTGLLGGRRSRHSESETNKENPSDHCAGSSWIVGCSSSARSSSAVRVRENPVSGLERNTGET